MIKWHTVLVCGFMYSWSTIIFEVNAETCMEHCTYNSYGRDAECTNRGFTSIPTACPRAHMLDISYNSLGTLETSSLRGYRQLMYLHLENNQIESILVGAFNAVKRTLELLNISNNRLFEIRNNTFVNMTRLQLLMLDHNQISDISAGAFMGMNKLAKIYLGDNRLTRLEYAIFNQLPKLREINLRNNMIMSLDVSFLPRVALLQKIFVQNNSISEITGRAETAQTSLILINLSGNLLPSFSCSVIENLVSLNDLYLANNSLETIEGCGRQQMPNLKLSNNPFHCDCRIAVLAEWLEQNPDAPSPNCSSPASLMGTSIRDARLECTDQNDDMSETAFPTTYNYWMQKHSTAKKIIIPTVAQPWQSASIDTDLIVLPGIDSLGAKSTVHGAGVKAENSFNRNPLKIYPTSSPGNIYGMSTVLLIILISIVVLIIIVLVLLVLCLKHYCNQSLEEDEKKKYTMATTKTFVLYPEREVEQAEDATVPMSSNHNYESINEVTRSQTTPRQYRTDSEGSNATMLPIVRDDESHRRDGGWFNPGVVYTHDQCYCDCHERSSGTGESWTDSEGSCSDLSYETDNRLNNEISECRPLRSTCCGVLDETTDFSRTMPVAQSCGVPERRRFLTSSLNDGYPPPTYEVSFKHPSPPHLPPKHGTKEIYIQHNQLQSIH